MRATDTLIIVWTLLCIPSIGGADVEEINALLELKHSFVDVNGSLSTWSSLNGDNVCNWNGIECNTENHITKIELSNQNLSGIVAPQIANLHYLQELYLSLNENITGNLPNVMGLENIRVLRFDLCSFTGGFYFHEAANWKTPLGRSLQEIWVDANQLEGTIQSAEPNAFSSSPIQVLRYGKQAFYGTLPSGYEGFPDLQDLRVGFNDFVGKIPSGWQTMNRLNTLYLPNLPKACGSIPEFESQPLATNFERSSFGAPCEEPDLYYQNEIDVLLDFRASLELSHSVLESWADENKAVICEEDGWRGISCDDYNHVRAIELDNLGLSGTIPETLSDLKYLETLSLEGNSLYGELPSLYSSALNVLKLTNNSFSGPSYLNDDFFWETRLAASLQILNLAHNQLSGTIQDGPSYMFWRSSLIDLNLANNELEGTLPTGFSGLLHLKHLNLSNNAFHGSVPDWTPMPQIRSIDLTGSDEICGQHSAFIETSASHRDFCDSNDSESAHEALRKRLLEFIEKSDQYLKEYNGLISKQRSTGDEIGVVEKVIIGGAGLAALLLTSIAWAACLYIDKKHP